MKPTALRKAWLLGIGLTVLGGLGGCKACGAENGSGAATDAAPSASASGVTTASASPSTGGSASAAAREALGDRRLPMNVGPYTFLFGAARGVTLKDEQKAKIDAAAASARTEDARDETKAFRTELAAEVKAGKIEPGKLEPHYTAIDKAAKARHEKEAEAANALHAVLEPAQRTEVVTTARARQAKRDHHAGDGGTKGLGERMAKRRVDRMKAILGLDDEQVKKLEAVAAKEETADTSAETGKRNEALLAAFEKDGFDAKKIDPPDSKKMRAMLQKEPQFLAQIVPILTPAQRDKLAVDVDHGRAGGHGRRPNLRHLDRLPSSAEDDDDEP